MPHDKARLCAFVDKDQQDASVQVSFNHQRRKVDTAAASVAVLKGPLFQVALNNKLAKISRKPNPPFCFAEVTQATLPVWYRLQTSRQSWIMGFVTHLTTTVMCDACFVNTGSFEPSSLLRMHGLYHSKLFMQHMVCSSSLCNGVTLLFQSAYILSVKSPQYLERV